jgi:hypothetical protein
VQNKQILKLTKVIGVELFNLSEQIPIRTQSDSPRGNSICPGKDDRHKLSVSREVCTGKIIK